MFTCEHEIKEKLTERAKLQNRTVSNLVETLVIDALTSQQEQEYSSTEKNSKGVA
ncbi:ribbon-helix-helix domain-containing protein [Plectonema radiosum]|nr:hypothetical protein [Plectonema radiosum]